jgi:hypothetical protein
VLDNPLIYIDPSGRVEIGVKAEEGLESGLELIYNLLSYSSVSVENISNGPITQSDIDYFKNTAGSGLVDDKTPVNVPDYIIKWLRNGGDAKVTPFGILYFDKNGMPCPPPNSSCGGSSGSSSSGKPDPGNGSDNNGINASKSLADKESKIANEIGRTVKEVKNAIEKVKQGGGWRNGTKNRNPDVKKKKKTGEVYPKTPSGGYGDSIGNIYDYLP